MLGRLRHPNINQALAFMDEEENGNPYGHCLVLELQPGGSLRSYLVTVGDAMDTATFFSVALDVAAALDHLHRRNIVVRVPGKNGFEYFP